MNRKNSQGFKGNRDSTFRGQSAPEIPGLNGTTYYNDGVEEMSESKKTHKKDLKLLMKIVGENDFEKFKESYFGKDYYMSESSLYSNNYNKGKAIFDYVDILISNKVNIKEGSLKGPYLRSYFDIYVDENDEKKWDDMKLWYKMRDEIEKYKTELGEFKKEIVAAYEGNKSNLVLISLFNEGIRSNHDETLQLLEKENEIRKLVKIKRRELENRVHSAYKNGSISSGQSLECSLSNDEGRYELKIRESGNTSRLSIHVIIIEDLEKIRNNIIDILPNELGDNIDVKFTEIDNLHEASEYMDMQRIISKVGSETFIILDNNFFEYKNERGEVDMRRPKADMGVKLYKGISKDNKDMLDNVSIVSSDSNISEKFPEGTNIISGKSRSNLTYISRIADWINGKMK